MHRASCERALRTFESIAIAHTVVHKYFQILLHLLLTDCRKSSFLSLKKELHAVSS